MRKIIIFTSLAIALLSILLFVAVWVKDLYVEPSNAFKLEEVTPIFESNIEMFTDFARDLSQQTIVHSLCRKENNVYTVNGDWYDFADNSFGTAPGSPIASGRKTTFEELLQARIT